MKNNPAPEQWDEIDRIAFDKDGKDTIKQILDELGPEARDIMSAADKTVGNVWYELCLTMYAMGRNDGVMWCVENRPSP